MLNQRSVLSTKRDTRTELQIDRKSLVVSFELVSVVDWPSQDGGKAALCFISTRTHPACSRPVSVE